MRTRTGWLVLAPFLTAACGGGDDRAARVVVSPSDCDTLEPCSIADRACQRGILAITACVRGDEAPALPPIRTLDRSQLRAELEAQQTSSATDMPDASQQLLAAAFEKALEALQLVTPAGSLTDALADEQLGSIAAFYRDDERDVTVISDTTMDELTAMNELAHELTHYLQDEAGQLAVAHKPNVTIDESVARRALTEGEAVVSSYRASAQMMGYTPLQVSWNKVFVGIEDAIADATNASGSPFLAALNQLPYALSPRAIEAIWESGGRTRVDALFDHPPRTALDWLGDNPGGGSSRVESLDCQPPLPPEGHRLLGTTSLGVTGLYALLGTRGGAALDAAGIWRGDVLALYHVEASGPEDPRVLAVWRMRLGDEAAAMRVMSSIAPLGLSVSRFGRELAISVSSDEAQAPLGAATLASCPTVSQLRAAFEAASDVHASLRLPRVAAARWFHPELLAP